MHKILKITFALIMLNFALSAYPVAIFHGIGDACVNSKAVNLINHLYQRLGVYARCIETGDGKDSWLISIKDQAQSACKQINEDPNFSGYFNIIGISQGTLLGRYIIEACQMNGRVMRYVSIGGPQMGVAKVPRCNDGLWCDVINGLASTSVYWSFVQNSIAPAGYFKDVTDYDDYCESTFLADLNNEKKTKNQNYKARFSSLEYVVLVKFAADTVIIPKETAWFQFWNAQEQVLYLNQQDFYNYDFIGLRYLVESNKVNFVTFAGEHTQFTYEEIDNNVIPALS